MEGLSMIKEFNNIKHLIEFKHVTNEYMLDEVKEIFVEYVQSLDTDLSFQDFQNELKSLPGKYAPPDGALVLALFDNKVAGCIALRKINDDVCEMKRLYVRDCYRMLGVGKALISHIINEAHKLNYSYMRLDTLPSMNYAHSLYSSFEFYDINPYIYNPIEGARFMELKIKNYE